MPPRAGSSLAGRVVGLVVVTTVTTVALGGCDRPGGGAGPEPSTGAAQGGAADAQAPEPARAPTVGPRVRRDPAERADLAAGLAVLHEWDRRRAAAWSDGDAAALGRLYAQGTAARRADLRLLREYADRGLVVRRLVTQVLAVRVLHRRRDSLRLSVHDRVAGGVLRDGAWSRPLPSTRPVTRTVRFRRTPSGWVVVQVSDSVRAPRAARP